MISLHSYTEFEGQCSKGRSKRIEWVVKSAQKIFKHRRSIPLIATWITSRAHPLSNWILKFNVRFQGSKAVLFGLVGVDTGWLSVSLRSVDQC